MPKPVITSITLCISFLLLSQELYGQRAYESGYSFTKKFDIDDGLSQLNVSSLLKDSDGFLWIGTDDGLNRFDGYNFEVFRHISGDSSSIADNKVYSLCEDQKGRIWAGTNLGGLQLYNKQTRSFKKYIHEPGNDSSLSNNTVLKIIECTDGFLWIGTNQGLNKFDPETGKFTRFYKSNEKTGLAGNQINAVLESNDGKIWIGAEEGLTILDKKTLFTKKYYHSDQDPNSLIYNSVISLFSDSEGNIWIGTEGGGICMYNPDNDSFIRYIGESRANSPMASSIVHSIEEDDFGNIWFSSWGEGIFVYEKDKSGFSKIVVPQNDEINSAIVFTILNSGDGNIWVGTYENGVKVLSNKRKAFHHVEVFNDEMSALGRNTVRTIFEDSENNIWFATDGSGLYKYLPTTKSYVHFLSNSQDETSLSGNIVKPIIEDKKGNIYAGTYVNGLNKVNKTTHKIIRLTHDPSNPNSLRNNNVWALCYDSQDRIWVGTLGGGMDEYIPEENRFIHHFTDPDDTLSISSDRISKIYEDSRRNLWIGTIGGGVCRMDRKNRTFIRYVEDVSTHAGVNFNEVVDIYEDQKKRLWISSNGGGLFLYNPKTDKLERIGEDHNLKGTILSILDDDNGNLWMGTFEGIIKYNPDLGTTEYFNQHDGLQSNDFKSGSKLKSSTGEFYFGGSNGYNVFRPADIVTDSVFHPIVLTDLFLFHEKVNIYDFNSVLTGDINYQNSVVLAADQNTISFQYSSLDYTFPKSNYYAYKLEGFDRRWNYVQKERKATYTNLSPGNYVFQVKSTNNDGLWSDDYKSIEVIITPPFWMTWWFRIAAFIFVVSSVLLIFSSRTKKLRRKNVELEVKVSERTAQLNDLVKDLRENKDELTTTLDDLHEQKKYVEEINQQLERTHEELRTTNEELDIRVQERTSRLTKVNQELDRFVYSASHELSSPLKSILGLVNITKLENKNLKLQSHLEHIENSVHKLEEVIISLTQFSRNLKVKVAKEKVDMSKLIDSLLVELKYLTNGEAIDFRKNITTDSSINSDPARLTIILTNLVSNAIKYRDTDKPESWILIEFLKEKDIFKLKVRDNGVGIDKKVRRKVFDMFYRGSTLSFGSGLGLYIVKETVEKMNGQIQVESELNEWAEFTINLPLES